MDIFQQPAPPRPPAYPPSQEPTFQSTSLTLHEIFRDSMLAAHNASHDRPKCISLARTILGLDKLDVNLQQGKKYRDTLNDRAVEDTLIVLHHLSPETRESLIKSDYKALSIDKTLPDQLDEKLTDNKYLVKNTVNDPSSNKRPIIYQHYHVDNIKTPPTMEEYYQVATDDMTCYHRYGTAILAGRRPRAADAAKVKDIDKQFLAPSPDHKAPREEYVGANPRYGCSKSFLESLMQLIQEIKQMYRHTLVSERNKPCPYAISESGWTNQRNARRWAHFEHGDNSNKLMNLVEAATKNKYSSKGYRMRWIIVLEISKPDLAGPAERAISRLSGSYTTCWGTNGIMAGISVHSTGTIGNNLFLAICNRLAVPMERSASEDIERVEARKKEIEDIEKTKVLYGELETCGKEGKRLITMGDSVEQKLEKRSDELATVAPAWFDQLEKTQAALDEYEQLEELAQQLNTLL